MSAKQIAVIGAGIIGLAVARSLAMSRHGVTIFERSHIGAGTSAITFAWVNANGKGPESYHRLNAQSMDEHVRLQQESGLDIQWLIQAGTYEWAETAKAQEQLHHRVQKLLQLGYPARLATHGELHAAVPEIRLSPRAGDIWHFPSEMLVHPSLLLARLWSQARANGAVLRTGSDVVDITEQHDKVSLSLADGRQWQGDNVVIATGRWSEDMVKCLGHSLAMIDANRPDEVACGFLAYTNPLPVQLQANLISPEMNVRPDGGGRLILQALDLDNHANPALPAAIDGFIGQEMLRRLRRLFANTEPARIDRIAVGQRARPADGLPAVGFVTPLRRAYLVATHSGITLAPLLGRLVAEELTDGDRPAMLHDFAPDRLLDKTADDFAHIAFAHFPAAQ